LDFVTIVPAHRDAADELVAVAVFKRGTGQQLGRGDRRRAYLAPRARQGFETYRSVQLFPLIALTLFDVVLTCAAMSILSGQVRQLDATAAAAR
jgi:hypothetical protein